jgi:hypothetical protein
MVEVALQLPWLKHLAIRPGDAGWPAELAAQVKQAMPGCRLESLYTQWVFLFGSE